MERLRRLEGVVQTLGVQVEEETQQQVHEAKESFQQIRKVANTRAELGREGCSRGITSSLDTTVEGLEQRFGRLVTDEGRSRYINNSFWASLNNEVEDLRGILNDPSDDEEDYPSPSTSQTASSHQGFIFGYSSQNVDMFSLHPPAHHVPKYWEVFKENVDPLVKVIHVPTTEPKILGAKDHLDNLQKGLECLLFAIYYGAITSLMPNECVEFFGEEQVVLLSRYRFGLEQALARAHFLTSDEIIVLQAFVIFLILLRRNDDARVIWTLTGLVVRISQTLGIHRDGSHFHLSPFEIEMRRRLWWQVCILDARASEDHGSDPTIVEAIFDTQMPLNVNDSDLSPGMKELPESRTGFTEMTFCLIRFEVANIFRRILYVPPGPVRCNQYFASLTIEEKEKWIMECHQNLEERYLQHCDLTVPLYWVAATISRLVMSKMWLVVYHPMQRIDGGASLPQETKDKLFLTSLENVEYSILLATESRTMRFGWLFRTYVQWHAIAFLLSELCVRTKGEHVERAWRAIDATVASRWGNPIGESKRGFLWKPLRKLMIKARAARQAELAREMSLSGTPHSIFYSDHIQSPAVRRESSFAEAYPNFEARVQVSNSPSVISHSAPPSTVPIAQTSQPPQSPTNKAAQDFMAISDHGFDWLMGDVLGPDLRTAGAAPINDEPVDWANWDDMVRQWGTDVDPGQGLPLVGAGPSGMPTWF